MELVWLIARLGLAAVFAVAGVGKLLDLSGSADAVRGFGMPERYARALGTALPVLELIAAALLLPVSTAFWGALLATFLLLTFVGGIVNSLRKGETPDCHCFGQFHSEPIGTPTLVRNGLLVAVGLLILAGGTTPGPSLLGWLGDESGTVRVLTALVALVLAAAVVEGWLIAHLLGQSGRFLIMLDELKASGVRPDSRVLPVGPVATRSAPAFAAPGITGERVTRELLRASGRPVLLFFSDTKCGPCTALLPEVAGWQKELAGRVTVAVVTRGTLADTRAKSSPHGLKIVALDPDRDVAKLYGVAGTPAAVHIDRHGMLASPVAAGPVAIRALVEQVRAEPAANGTVPNGRVAAHPARPLPTLPPRPVVGDPAPIFSLPTPSGAPVGNEQLLGRDAVLLFWNPGCGFCRRLVPDLHEWANEAGPERPKVVVVTSGRPEDTSDLTFADVLLEPRFATGKRFGASGTPSGVALDADGKIASPLAVGGPGILELLRSRSTALSRSTSS